MQCRKNSFFKKKTNEAKTIRYTDSRDEVAPLAYPNIR